MSDTKTLMGIAMAEMMGGFAKRAMGFPIRRLSLLKRC